MNHSSYNYSIPRHNPSSSSSADDRQQHPLAPQASPSSFSCEIKSASPLVVRIKSSATTGPLSVLKSIRAGGKLPSFSIPRKKRKLEETTETTTSSTRSASRSSKLLLHDESEEEEEEEEGAIVERTRIRKSSSLLIPTNSTTSKATTPNPNKKTSTITGSSRTTPEESPTVFKSARGRLRKKSKTYNDESDDEELNALLKPIPSTNYEEDPNAIDAPPPGQLASLWYSQESFLHVFVIEKILAWKIRNKHPIISDPDKETSLTLEIALKLQEKAIEACAQDQSKRMEISRINAMQCPVVLSIWQNAAATNQDTTTPLVVSDTALPHPNNSSSSREEVFLIKWRGKSYKHCSWERATDLIKFDVASNNTAKGKMSRFAQSQEMALGKNWKKLLDEGRRGTAQPTTDANDETEEVGGAEEEEEFFPSEYLEVERILLCDETEMSMDVFAKQRYLNLKAQKEELLEQQDAEETCAIKRRSETTAAKLKQVGQKVREELQIQDKEQHEVWDPEDYVRYVVKYKSLPMSELHWEYWKDLKHDYVEVAEDFWYRQREPTDIVTKPHPEIQDFRKLTESPLFGICTTKPRPIWAEDGDSKNNEPVDDKEEKTNALQLRSYQLEGVNWLLWNWFNKRSCILADEMGLGKTCQAVSFLKLLSTLDATRVRGPFLVVAPLSLISQWNLEATAWDPDLNIIVYHGHADARAYLQEHEFYYNEPFVSKATAIKLKRQNVTKFHLLITTYEVAMKDIAVLSKIRWRVLIVDEAHRLKNNKSRLFLELGAVPRDFCLLLTGTPLQNSTEELFALLNFADQVNFQDRNTFIERFGQLTDSKQVNDLHTVLKPYLLRRVKEDVAKSLPPKEETILEVSLTPLQKTYYKAIYERNTSFLFKGAKPNNAPSLMNIMMELRKCCNHPFLIRGVEERILTDAANAERASAELTEEGEAPPIDMLKIYGEQLVKSSGKMVLLAKLLPKLFNGGHKVLIFSQMVRVLDIFADFLRLNHYKFERLDGSTSAAARNAAVERFNRFSCQRFVMLLSTRAGGLGLNLTSADVVIIADSDWNPQNDLQAMARAHRIGQTRAVRVYRLLTAKTYEMHMFHSASMKLGLDRAVLAQQRQNNESEEGDGEVKKSKSSRTAEREKQAKEIDELLKKGAYDVFRDDDDNEAQQFMETDIDALLERSTKSVSYGSATNTISKGLGSFSKASFVTSNVDGGQDVDLDDPDFWKKAIGLQEPAEAFGVDEATALLVGSDKKRNRKQVQVYDPYAPFAEAEMKKEEQKQKKSRSDKEEKDRLRQEKKSKVAEEEKSQKGAESRATKSPTEKVSSASKEKVKAEKDRKISKETKSKSFKSAEMLRKERIMENRNPVFEQIKYAWEAKHRDLVIDGILKFGFGRFCKVRNEGCLVALPIQDLEIFIRAYIYILGLQAAVPLIAKFRRALTADDDSNVEDEKAMSSVMNQVISRSGSDGLWMCGAILNSIKLHQEVCSDRRSIRIPPTLVESIFISKLRNGTALWSLRRLSFLSRLNHIMNAALDAIMQELGPDEIGKRGSPTKNAMELDVDMKAKVVTTEELSHAVGKLLRTTKAKNLFHPAPWWDRSCDIALIIGTFIHGLGSYESMGRDPQLPFGYKIDAYSVSDLNSANSLRAFGLALKQANNFGVIDAGSKTTVDPKNNENCCVTNGHTNGEVAETKRALPKDRPELSLLGQLSNTLSSTFRANSFNDIDDVAGISSSALDFLQEKRLIMPDGTLLDGLLLSLVEMIEKNMGVSYQKPSIDEIETYNCSLWELDEVDVATLAGASVGRFQSNFFSTSSCPDSSHYLHSPALKVELEPHASSKVAEDKQKAGTPLVLTHIGVTALLVSSKETVRLLSENLSSSEYKIDCPLPWNSNEVLRRNLCIALLNVGSPVSLNERFKTVHVDILLTLGIDKDQKSDEAKFFTFDDFRKLADAGEVDNASIESYVNNLLLPHCLRLTIYGNDRTTTRAAPVEENKKIEPVVKKVLKRPGAIIPELEYNHDTVLSSYDDAFVLRYSTYFPDPSVAIEAHSDEAVVRALAILRRVKLMKAVRFIVGGGVPVEDILSFLNGPVMRRNLDGVPIWWCPWIHDLAVLVNASIFGLFSLHSPANRRSNSGGRVVFAPCLGKEAIERHIRSVFVEGEFGNKPMLPQCYLSAKGVDVDNWVREQATYFPSARVIDRRLACLCAALTSSSTLEGDDESRYDNVPMFDHGGWPSSSVSDMEVGSIHYGTSSSSRMLNLSLLRRVEEDA